VRVYVAGPMSGMPEHNFPAFRVAAEDLRERGHEVISPVEMDEADGFDGQTEPDTDPGSSRWAEFLARDLKVVVDVDAVVVIEGWERSRGAALEVHVARELGKPIYRLPALPRIGSEYRDLVEVKAPTKYQPPTDETCLETASRLVDGDRNASYGHPAEDFARTAGMWHSLFGWDVDEKRVALAMVCVKLSRLIQTPDHRDSVTDGPGYFRTYEAVLARAGVPGFRDLGPRVPRP
jgi:hypothetical protein